MTHPVTQPVTPLVTLIGVPGDACEGDDCLPVPEPAERDAEPSPLS